MHLFCNCETGALGYGDQENRCGDPFKMGDFLPFLSLGDDFVIDTISLGESSSCALSVGTSETSRLVKCWGANGLVIYTEIYCTC